MVNLLIIFGKSFGKYRCKSLHLVAVPVKRSEYCKRTEVSENYCIDVRISLKYSLSQCIKLKFINITFVLLRCDFDNYQHI